MVTGSRFLYIYNRHSQGRGPHPYHIFIIGEVRRGIHPYHIFKIGIARWEASSISFSFLYLSILTAPMEQVAQITPIIFVSGWSKNPTLYRKSCNNHNIIRKNIIQFKNWQKFSLTALKNLSYSFSIIYNRLFLLLCYVKI